MTLFIAMVHLKIMHIKGTVRTLPKYLKREVGQHAMFRCVSHMTKKWFFEGGKLPSNVVLSSSRNWLNLVILKATLKNSGHYSCHVKNEDGGMSSTQSILEVVR